MEPGSAYEFEMLLRPQFTFLYRIAYRFAGNRADAEDLLQDLLVKLYRRKNELKKVENLRPWLVRVLYRLFLDERKKQKRSPLHLVKTEREPGKDDPLDEIPSRVPDPEQYLHDSIRTEHIEKALDALSDDHRAIIVLHDIEGYRLKELELLLEVPLGTLKSRLSRAREILREILRNEGSLFRIRSSCQCRQKKLGAR